MKQTHFLPAIAAACLFHSIRVEGGHPTVSCYTSRKSEQLIASQCLRALDTIIWDQNLNLDSTSNPLVVGYAECMIKIEKPRGENPKRDHVIDIVQDVINSCPSRGGVSSYIHGMSAQVYPASAGDIDNINLPVCSARRCSYESHDCRNALEMVGPDPAMVYLSPSSFTSGNCTLTLATNDDSPFSASATFLKPTYEKLAKRCNSEPGWIHISNGTSGTIDGLRLSTQGSQCS
ncbi:hypothetical protein MJO28_001689 [Puccinia striiformis f. sp. tritici]|uniref:Uncharacterized protein n=4 Tax=Puccinia striiformis TaxID=27350 RepID=A0A0L0W5H3_9BASI|nr:hypothetical protein Pst134EA_003069 [Puccinia striiformis f. sp. tritici]KAI9629647.1 hypothetical protein KEM48_012711 [Puccinia striiformis f. sp. tritici PST-130]KNF06485.1 hypothetical protein PSTG_00361 [Puccinia striiformis f. sp. tritici PST-78]POV94311.1 hypothetical protein PSTT_16916 [Puccinia striiformis]KAH9464610.1 hypothetical protein Pst134EB_004135 [Puccinia striiformis f. sp. tritici]KAH9472455.1 hypothetical protein Pst134EA_003069 [Puccinia striiformis f. sp. tritici]